MGLLDHQEEGEEVGLDHREEGEEAGLDHREVGEEADLDHQEAVVVVLRALEEAVEEL